MALGIIIGFVVGVAVMFFMNQPLDFLSEDERKELEHTIKMALLRKYKQ